MMYALFVKNKLRKSSTCLINVSKINERLEKIINFKYFCTHFIFFLQNFGGVCKSISELIIHYMGSFHSCHLLGI